MEPCSFRDSEGAVKPLLTSCKGCNAHRGARFRSALGQKSHETGPIPSRHVLGGERKPCSRVDGPGMVREMRTGWMNRPRLLLSAWMLLFPSMAAPFQKPPDVEAVLAHLDDLYRSKSSVSRMEIQVAGRRTTRTLRMKAWTRGEEEVLVVIEEPPREAGTATLRVGEQSLELSSAHRPNHPGSAGDDAGLVDGDGLSPTTTW